MRLFSSTQSVPLSIAMVALPDVVDSSDQYIRLNREIELEKLCRYAYDKAVETLHDNHSNVKEHRTSPYAEILTALQAHEYEPINKADYDAF